MKKILFASTALVAAGLLTSGSADAAEKINLQLAGYSKWWVVGAWQSNEFTGGANGNAGVYNNAGVKGDNEVWFTGSTTLNNGLKVGITVELEAGGHTDQASDPIDRSWVWVEGGFGKVQLGTNKNAAYLLGVQAPDAAGNWTHDGIITGNYAILKPGGVNVMAGGNTTMINETDSAESVSYFTPKFYGLTLGVSYTPRGGEDNRNFANLQVAPASATWSLMRDAYAAGGLYANTFGGVGVKVSGGALWSCISNTAGALGALTSFFDWDAGVQLSYAGFTLGSSYRQVRVDDASSGAVLGTTSSGSLVNGKAWDVGLQYATGPYAVSATYLNTQTDGTATYGSGPKDKVRIYQISGKYNLGPGVDVLATGGYAEYYDGVGSAVEGATSNSGWTVMSGLSLSF